MTGFKMTAAHHILGYAQSFKGGGVERALLRLAGAWVEAGRRVTLVVADPRGPLAAEVAEDVDVVPLGSATYRALFALPRHVRTIRPDVIFCAGSHYTSVAAWTRLRLRGACPPIVGKVSNAIRRPDHHVALAPGHAAWLLLHPLFLDRVVGMSAASAAAIAAAMRLAPEDVVVIPNPPARPIPSGAPAQLPPRYILGVGRLARQKRWDRLVAAVPRLRDRQVPLVILGEGEERAALMAQAQTLGIADRLIMPGHVRDPLGAMANAAVVALSSDFEGVPGVLREALSVGTPVVATDASPAVAEIVVSPVLGTIVARDDPDALIAALDHWLDGAARPAPVPPPGADSALRYLELFDSLRRA